MSEINKLFTGLPILFAVLLLGCNDEEVVRKKTTINIQRLQDKQAAAEPAEPVDASLIKISENQLEVKVSLDGAESERNKLTRFVRIKEKQLVEILESKVYIRTGIKEGAILTIMMQLLYQPEYNPKDEKNLTIVSNQFTARGPGFRWYNQVIGCKNSDCSIIFKRRMPKIEQMTDEYIVPKKVVHKISIIWDEDNFQYVFSYNDTETSIDMQPFVNESAFDPRNFQFARLVAEVSNVNGETDHGTITVRFGKVYVNGQLYDDFSDDQLNSDKWRTGQTKQ